MLFQRVQLVCDVGVGMLHCPSQPWAGCPPVCSPRAFPSRIRVVDFFFSLPGKVEMLFFLFCVSGALLAEFFSDLHFPKSPKH